MNEDLRYHLVEGPYSVKNLTRLMGKSETWVRTELKKHNDEVRCMKDTAGQNVFWIEETENSPETPVEPTPEPEAISTPDAEVIAQADDPDAPHCPLCQSTADQTPAGEEGTFLGACLTCPDCGKTYNAINGKEVKDAPTKGKGKRTILNPQHKIRAKTEAVEAAGGKLRFDKNDRLWVLEGKEEVVEMNAQTFANHTPETLAALVG